jgi:hypothetical protein
VWTDVSGRRLPAQISSIPRRTSRRKFFFDRGRAALGFSSITRAGGSAPPQNNTSALILDLEKRLPALLAQSPTVPAVSMALIADAKLLWRGAFGVKDFDSKTPVRHDTVFESGSVSKTAFAYVVMKLCEKGVLDHDAPCPVAYNRFSELAIGDGAPDNSLHTGRALELFGRRIQLPAVRRGAPGRSCEPKKIAGSSTTVPGSARPISMHT